MSEIIDSQMAESKEFKTLAFPIQFEFKIGTLANDFIATDGNGSTLAYVRQKMFKFKEDITIYSNDKKENILYTIKADRIIDFNACYAFYNEDGDTFGKVGRKGMKSLWKANYEIFDDNNSHEYTIKEENPFAKVCDVLLGEIPLLGMFTGYLFNPRFAVTNKTGDKVAQLKKEPSFWGRKFKLTKEADFENEDEERMMLALMMMSLLERRRG